MKNLSEKSIPFFGYQDDPYRILILDDRIFGFDVYGSSNNQTSKAAYLLWKLLQCKEAKKVFPTKIRRYLTGQTFNPLISNSKLFGVEENVAGIVHCFRCFDLDISIDFSRTKPIIFQDMIYQKIPLNSKIFLSIEEAALTLANICAAQIKPKYLKKLISLNTEKQINEQIILPIISRYKSNKTREENRNFNSLKFRVYYFKYMQWLLLEKRINPKHVLNYSGLGTLIPMVELPSVFSFLEHVMENLLNSDRISKQQLIVYFVFFELVYLNIETMEDIQKIKTLLNYYKRNKRLLEQLRNKIRHPYPDMQEDTWKIQSF